MFYYMQPHCQNDDIVSILDDLFESSLFNLKRVMDLDTSIKKNLLLISSLTECFMLSGPANGWPSLVYVLREDGYFSDVCLRTPTTDNIIIEYESELCKNTTPNQGDHGSVEDYFEDYPTCAEQDARLQLVFLIASFAYNIGALIFGVIYDRFGLRIARTLSSSLILLGFLMLAFSSCSTSFILFIALPVLVIGAANLQLSNPLVGNLFGRYRSTIITLHSGATVSSAITMLLVQVAYTKGISMMASCCFLAGVTVFFNVNTFVLPKYKIPWPLPPNWGKAVAVTPTCSNTEVPDDELTELNEYRSTIVDGSSEIRWMDVEYWSLLNCLTSPMFLLFSMWTSIVQLIHYFYIGTINHRLQQLTNDNDEFISTYTISYTALQSTIVVFAFLCGIVLDRNKNKRHTPGSKHSTPFDDLQDSILALLLTNLLTALFGMCSMIPIVQLQFLTFILQIMGISFLVGLIVGFPAMVFPTKHFGSIYGVCRVIVSCVSLVQYPLFQMVQRIFDGNPFYVDLLLLLLNACTLVQPLYVYYFVSKMKRIYVREEEDKNQT